MDSESKTIHGTGYGDGIMIFNAEDKRWNLVDAVDTSHPRYRATEDDMAAAIAAAKGTLIRNIGLSE